MASRARTLLLRGLCLVAAVILTIATPADAQSTSTFSGRVVDQADAVLPGVTVTTTNTSTGVVRTGVTNGEGAYYLPGLDPGAYTVRVELPGFAPTTRERVTLGINATITLDFRMSLAGVSEAVTVTGAAPLIEVTQSKVASTIKATELQNLPMITRSVSGLLALLPGAAPMEAVHRSKENVGSGSFGGASGTNVAPTVDGADNRDNRYGGPLMTFSTDALEQFQLSTSQFTAAEGRTGGAALTMVTKSGTNVFHGTAFGFARDRSLSSKDYFSKASGQAKAPYSRQQFGGSAGGPILRNKMFFFGAVEQIYEDTRFPVPARLYDELELLVTATNAGRLPRGLVNPNHPRFAPTPGEVTLSTVKVNTQLNNSHTLMGRFAHQRDDRDAVTLTTANDLREPENSTIRIWSAVAQHGWVLGNRGLNQFTGQVNHMYRLSDVTSNITGEHYTRDFPTVNMFPARLSFPSVNTGAGGAGGSLTDTYVIQFREDLSLITGNHSIRLGANFNSLPNLGTLNANEHFPTLTFFDDPSVILSNSNGRYPQGFSTPGIVRQWQQANGGVVNGAGYMGDNLVDAKQAMGWVQDDWRATSRLTLNLGVRYDVDFEFYDQKNYRQNAARIALEGIGHPYQPVVKVGGPA